jgi:hypothetical protein
MKGVQSNGGQIIEVLSKQGQKIKFPANLYTKMSRYLPDTISAEIDPCVFPGV